MNLPSLIPVDREMAFVMLGALSTSNNVGGGSSDLRDAEIRLIQLLKGAFPAVADHFKFMPFMEKAAETPECKPLSVPQILLEVCRYASCRERLSTEICVERRADLDAESASIMKGIRAILMGGG